MAAGYMPRDRSTDLQHTRGLFISIEGGMLTAAGPSRRVPGPAPRFSATLTTAGPSSRVPAAARRVPATLAATQEQKELQLPLRLLLLQTVDVLAAEGSHSRGEGAREESEACVDVAPAA